MNAAELAGFCLVAKHGIGSNLNAAIN